LVTHSEEDDLEVVPKVVAVPVLPLVLPHLLLSLVLHHLLLLVLLLQLVLGMEGTVGMGSV
jgi:hypothetical protein